MQVGYVTHLILYACRLSERLGSHSQLHKQRALSSLVAAVLTCKLDSQQLEPHHNLLSLVYWLARRPLESAYTPPAEGPNKHAGQPVKFTGFDSF